MNEMKELNKQMYQMPEKQEMAFTQEWQFVEIEERWIMRYDLSGIEMNNGVFTAVYEETRFVDDEVAIAELRALVLKWRENGKSCIADALECATDEDGEPFSIYDLMGEFVKENKAISSSEVKFYGYTMPDGNALNGIRYQIAAAAHFGLNKPSSHAAIKNIRL